MATTADRQSRVRPLYAWEIEEAHTVFGDTLHYDRVRVHERVTWSDAIDRLGRRLKRMPPPGPSEHNALTLGYDSFFPVQLPETLIPPGQPLDYMIEWLIHELTHAWQFQHRGWSYLAQALMAQFRLGSEAYNFGGSEALVAHRQEGWTFSDFNPEQQGDIARSYYANRRAGGDVSAWLPYIQDLQRTV